MMSNLDKKYSLRLDLRINFTNSTMKFDEFDINTSDFFIKVTRNKELIDISEAIVTLVAIKPDGTVESQFVTITENNVYCDLKPSMKDIPGRYEAIASITINGETINTDPTNPIVYEVTENKFLRKLDAAVVSEERFSILTDMINKLSVIQNQENDRVEAEKTRDENAKKAITELNNIAKNFDNTVIEKVKEKVDEVIEPTLNEKLPSIVSNKIESIKEELKGEQGDKGDKGDKGDIGPRGETGPAGPQGERGIQGKTGPQGKTGATGQKGEQGERGEQGLPGNDGQDGVTPNIQIGNVTTLEPNQQATVVNAGTLENPIFDFGIPKGEGGGNANIDDTQISTDKTWSSDKISTWSMEQDGLFWVDKEDNFISADNTYEYKLKEVEIFGDTWQDSDNLSDIQHVGELYVDNEGIKHYKIELGVNNGVLWTGNFEFRVIPNLNTAELIESDNGGYGASDFIEIKEGMKLEQNNLNHYFFFDRYKKPITQIRDFEVTAPKKSKYVRIAQYYAFGQRDEYMRIKGATGIVKKEYKTTMLLPCQLMKVGDIADRLYWDKNKGKYIVEKKIDIPTGYDKLIDESLILETPKLIETNITKPIHLPTYNNNTHVYVVNSNNTKATIKAKFPLKTASAVANLKLENTKNSKDILDIKEHNVDIVATNFDIDYRLLEVEWALEDAGIAGINLINTLNTKGVKNMALSRYEQAKIMILGGAYDKETLTRQLTRYLEKKIITQQEHDELIALMEAKELVAGE